MCLSVARSPLETAEGARVWWANWQLPGGAPWTKVIRDATDEETALMEKVMWDRATPRDIDKLKELIQRS
jgi:hypothetical protein